MFFIASCSPPAGSLHWHDRPRSASLLGMKWLLALAAVPCLSFAQDSIERVDPKFDALVAPDAKIEVLCSGFKWSEGPVWDAAKQRLLFSDVPNNIIYQWKEGDTEAKIYMKPSGYTGTGETDKRESGSNGLAFDAKGQLLCCEHGDRRVSYLTALGGKRTLADNFDGKRFHSPNDLAVAPNGDVYFADPPYGHVTRSEKDPASEMDFCGVYRITPEGKVSLVTKEFQRPNGVALSPDGKTLYIAQSTKDAPVIKTFPIANDGSVGEGKIFFDMKTLNERGSPDGLKVDAQGNVFATGPEGVLVFDANAKLLGRIRCGGAANVAFGNDGRYLYIAAIDRVLRVALKK